MLGWFDASLVLPAATDAAGPTCCFCSIQTAMFSRAQRAQLTGSKPILVDTQAVVMIHATDRGDMREVGGNNSCQSGEAASASATGWSRPCPAGAGIGRAAGSGEGLFTVRFADLRTLLIVGCQPVVF
jgi:hypothetical protein